jgi:hypothetical protein
MMTDWMAARQIQVIEHLPSLPILPEPTFSFSPRVKRELAGLTLIQETFKKEWEGSVMTLLPADLARAFRQF